MPTYDYECEKCGYLFEAFHNMSAKSLTKCPECSKESLVKLISPGAAVIVRGTKTPCRGSYGGTKHKKIKNKKLDKLGQGKNKVDKPFWRDDPVNKKILKNPEKYIKEGKID